MSTPKRSWQGFWRATVRGRVAAAVAVALGAGSAWADTAAPPAPSNLPVEVELRQLCHTVLGGIERMPDPGRPRLVAVAPFAGGDDPATGDVRRLLTDYLRVVCLGRAQRVVVAEDTGADLVDADGAALPGRLAAAGLDVVVTGEVTRGATAYTTTARLYGPSAAEALSAVLHPLPLAATDAYVVATLRPRTPAAAVVRAALLPGWGQFYNREPTKGALFVSAEVILLGAAAGFYAAYFQARESYGAPVPERVASKQDAERYGTLSLVALGAAAAVWAGSIVDAWLSGHRYDPGTAFERAKGRAGTNVGAGGWEWGARW